ncbi:MAG: hypothetical protein IT377_13650, partial [Polyangiaceae bacterium]|nr:hypothetical protein [Polyangiaceae bacterium]
LTPFTSILALESEAAYYQMGIQRKRSKLRGKRQLSLLDVDEDTERRVAERHAAVLPPGFMPLGCSKSDAPGFGERASAGKAAPASPAPIQLGAPQEEQSDQKAETVAAQPAAPTALPEEPALTGGTAPGAGGPGRAGGLARAKADDEGDRAPHPRAAMPAKPAPEPFAKKVASAPVRLDADLPAGGKQAMRPKQAEDKKVEVAQGLPKICSDAAARPIAQRVLLWQKRLKTAKSPTDLIQRYTAALSSCELSDWRAERTFLDLMQKRVDGEGSASVVLGFFAARPEVQKFLAKLILRRAVDPRLVAAVERSLFGGAVDWAKLDLELSEIDDVNKRIERLREAIAKAPEDPNGGVRLVKLLVEADKKDEAVALGRRLRDQGLLTPNIARQIGDVLSRAGLADEAVRTYSEIVEFDPDGIDSRRLLGDIYLGHGWYEPAYRQYRTLTESAKDDALGWLRLAAAAAGTGRVDEALRLERKIASAQGTPGPSDPRRWARMLSAARLSRLIEKPPAGTNPEAMKRELKELQIFNGAGTLVLLTWEDLSADLLLVTQVDGKDVGLGETTDASKAGLSSVLLTTADVARASFVARLRSPKKDVAVKLERHDATWNGKDFQISSKAVELPKASSEASL